MDEFKTSKFGGAVPPDMPETPEPPPEKTPEQKAVAAERRAEVEALRLAEMLGDTDVPDSEEAQRRPRKLQPPEKKPESPTGSITLDEFNARVAAAGAAVDVADLAEAIVNTSMKMTPRKAKFAIAMGVGTDSIVAVAKKIGYKATTLKSWMEEEEVIHLTALVRKQSAQQVVGALDWKKNKLIEIVERCLDAAPVKNRRGEIIDGEWTCDIKGAIAAIRELNLMDGHHAAIQINQKTTVTVQHSEVLNAARQRLERRGVVLEGQATREDDQ